MIMLKTWIGDLLIYYKIELTYLFIELFNIFSIDLAT